MALLGSAFLAPAASPPEPARAPQQVSGGASVPAEILDAAAGSAIPGVPSAVCLSALLASGALLVGGGRQRRRAARTARHFFSSSSPSPALQEPKGPLAIPMLPQPAYRKLGDPLLRQMDAGFDPLDLATKPSPWGQGEDSYYNYREAEVKHGRLAMLATLGWLSSEELQGALARKFGLASDLAPGDLAPSLVNGGLGNLPSWFLPSVFMVTAWIELVPRRQGNRAEGAEITKYKPQRGRAPGDLGFDPLDLQSQARASLGADLVQLHNAEVKHGRAAMIAIVAFVAQEFVSKIPIISEDEVSADRLVSTIDKGIDFLDKATGLRIPDIPEPFPLN